MTRYFYAVFGAAGFVMDFAAHYLQAVGHRDAVLVTLKLMVGWSDAALFQEQYMLFAIGVLAHSMFLIGFVLLAGRRA